MNAQVTARSEPAVGGAGAPASREIPLDELRKASQAAGAAGDPEWLAHLRQQAFDAYAAGPLPDRVAHLWRYTDPALFIPSVRSGPGPAAAPDSVPAAGMWPAEVRALMDRGEISGAAFICGGVLRESWLEPSLKAAGVILEDLQKAAASRPSLVREHIGSLIPAAAGKFEALNSALWRGGVFLHIPRSVTIPKPIHLWSSAAGGLEAKRLLVQAGEASEVTVIDEYSGGSSTSQVHAVTEIFSGQAARVRHMAIQRLDRGARLHLAQRARADRDGRILSVIASLGGGIAKADLGTVLDGTGAEVELLGFLFGELRQHFDHHTVHHHRAGKTRSNLDFKVVLKDRSMSAYTGLIRIEREAPGSEAYQENRNLLLNDGTKAESIPELEILTDEVMCTHGATIGSLDPEQLFYFMSRGIQRPQARRMSVSGA